MSVVQKGRVVGRAAYRCCINRYVACFFLFFSCVGLLNYIVDPYWFSSHANAFNARQESIDIRQQKTNQITWAYHDYDALMIGSSRCNFISHRDFKGYRLFNYSMEAVVPEEYGDYISYARKQSRPGLRLLVLGLDFYGTNAGFHGFGQMTPRNYIDKTQNLSYRLSALFAFDSLRYSLGNIWKSFKRPNGMFYSRDGVKSIVPMSAPRSIQSLAIAKDLRTYREKMYGGNYRYKDMKKLFGEIKRSNPGVEIVAFTTPTSRPLWELLLAEGRLDDYCRWISDIVETYGAVYDFMGINSVTDNPANYLDAHHFYPFIGTMIVNRIMGYPDGAVPSDFGRRITRENLHNYLEDVKRRYSRVPGAANASRGA
jgi:hypothetical protein